MRKAPNPAERPPMPRLEEDRALLGQFRAGEARALEMVYREYAPRLARFLRGGFAHQAGGRFRGLGGSFELGNALQEVFSRAFEPSARMSYDGLRPYEAFLVGIARNYVFEELRRKEIAFGLFDNGPTRSPAEGGEPLQAPVEMDLEEREVKQLLAEFHASLSEEERALYVARFEEELTQDHAAKKLGMTRIQLRRREQKLKTELLAFLHGKGYLQGVRSDGWGFSLGREH